MARWPARPRAYACACGWPCGCSRCRAARLLASNEMLSGAFPFHSSPSESRPLHLPVLQGVLSKTI